MWKKYATSYPYISNLPYLYPKQRRVKCTMTYHYLCNLPAIPVSLKCEWNTAISYPYLIHPTFVPNRWVRNMPHPNHLYPTHPTCIHNRWVKYAISSFIYPVCLLNRGEGSMLYPTNIYLTYPTCIPKRWKINMPYLTDRICIPNKGEWNMPCPTDYPSNLPAPPVYLTGEWNMPYPTHIYFTLPSNLTGER